MTTTYNIGNRWTTTHTKKEKMPMRERVRSGLRIPYDLNTWLILEAKKLGYSKNALILQILQSWLKEHEERKEQPE